LQRATILNPTYFNSNNNAKYIKSTSLPDKKRLLIGWLNSNGVPNYGIYDINSNTNSYLQYYFMDSYCKFIPHGFKIDYYPEKSEIIYTCLFSSNTWAASNANILVETLNKNFDQTNYAYKYNGCDINGY
jgi:hypothetical protein